MHTELGEKVTFLDPKRNGAPLLRKPLSIQNLTSGRQKTVRRRPAYTVSKKYDIFTCNAVASL